MKKNNGKKSHILLKLILWIIAILVVAGNVAFSYYEYNVRPVTSAEKEYTVKIKVPSGTSTREIASQLKQEKLIRSEDIFYYAARFRLLNGRKPFVLKSGVYTVKSSMSMEEIYILLQSGAQEYITLSIPEGLTMRKIGLLLEEKGVCSQKDFLSKCCSTELLQEYNIPAENFEGYLFPDTYFFTPAMEAEDVVHKLADNFFDKAMKIDSIKELSPEDLHYKVRLASIIEREYRVKEEAPLIASVFTNRLRRNIGLYSCATVEYIITELEGRPHPEKITYDDLKIDSPYNTYKYAGLPPTPISNPGLIALDAAVNPAKTKYYYFVLTDPEKGTHTFSKDFDEHIAAEKGIPTKR